MKKENIDSRFQDLLREAGWYRFFSLCFQPPREGLKTEMEKIYSEVVKEENLYNIRFDDANQVEEHHSVLGAGGLCSACESEYVANRLGGKGLLMADVAGFYKAFSFVPEGEFQSPVDNISVELSFMSYMTLKEAFALFSGLKEEMQICTEAKEKFKKEHISQWVYLFAKKLNEVVPDSFYARVSLVMEDFISRRMSNKSV